MSNPFLTRLAKRGGSGHGSLSERRIMKKRGRLRPGSGSLPGAKGDGEIDAVKCSVLVEAKSTVKLSISLKHRHLKKITEEAVAQDRMPMLSLSFVRPDGNARDMVSDWAVIPMTLFDELTGGQCSRSSKS